jgi:hypothetical protein
MFAGQAAIPGPEGLAYGYGWMILEAITPGVPRLPTVGELRGGNAMALYEQGLDQYGELMLKFYYDRSQRFDIVWGEVRNTYDVEFQHSIDLPWSTDLSWGLQYRLGLGGNSVGMPPPS